MNPRCLPIVAAMLLVGVPMSTNAQPVAPAPSAAASAAPVLKPGRRVPTPAEKRDSATAPGEMRPERPVLPQIRIPLGKKPPEPAKPAAATAPRGAATPAIDDDAARCEALTSAQARAQCLDRHKRQHSGQR